MAIPLYGFVQGDTLGLLIMASEDETVKNLSERLQTGASVRVSPKGAIQVLYRQRILDLDMTAAEAGLQPFERFDVVAKER